MDRVRIPRVQMLTNGRYGVMVNEDGCGFSHWMALAVTRWGKGSAGGELGSYCYLRDMESGAMWSTTMQPVPHGGDVVEAVFSPGRATFSRRHVEGDLDIVTQTDVVVSHDEDVELRRVGISNRAGRSRMIHVTSYAEIVLEAAAVDTGHPAFEKLFVETEILPDLQAILGKRRARTPDESASWMFHLLLTRPDACTAMSYETDRMRFIGRGRSAAQPLAMDSHAQLSGSAGAVLDPVAAIRCTVKIGAGQRAVVDLFTGIASTREACLALVQRCRVAGFADRALAAADVSARADLAQRQQTEADAALYTSLASSVLYADEARRAAPSVLALNHLGQSDLWRYAISGDLPMVLLMMEDVAHLKVVQQFVRAHGYWRRHGLAVELLILVKGDEMQQPALMAAVNAEVACVSAASCVGKPAGIFILAAGTMPEADQVLIQSAAHMVISAADGLYVEQCRAGEASPAKNPQFDSRSRDASVLPAPQAEPARADRQLVFDNGRGGFTPDGLEYVIASDAGNMTPLPWINVLANPSFGTMVSESGSASTWSQNAQQYRLTPWSNDPVSDPNTEAFYIRDEDSGHFWSPTLLPTPSAVSTGEPYLARHGFGYSVFEHTAQDIASEMTMFVALEASIKFVVMRLHNASQQPRRLSVTGYVEWVLGDERRQTAMHVGTEVDAACGALFARNPYNTDFAGRTAFFDADAEGVDAANHSVCSDRHAFIGRFGSLREPIAMSQQRLSGAVGWALDPCAAIRVPVELAAGQARVLVFRLGAGATADEARLLVQRWCGPEAVQAALDAVKQHWRHVLGAVQVQTPDQALNILANGWLVYQTLSCRLWARTAFYQASGAFGFRDQLQDVMALLYATPTLAREHLLRCAARQYPEGDVQHWWHPTTGRGVRTLCSDDALWLPLATARYVQVTGDTGVLDEPVHFVEGAPLKSGEVSSYGLPSVSNEVQPLYEHCRRAIEHGLRFGIHGLPLMGSCDWNDGMNLVGVKGRGESVWLGFFLCSVLKQFSELAGHRGDEALSARYVNEAAHLRTAIEQSGWDGAWYTRAWFDDGSSLGTSGNDECRIDSIAQSWAVLSGAGDARRARLAMASLDRMLVDRDAALIRLLTPPFDQSSPCPGYIQGYVRGVRENGGQYTHAAVWAAMAFAALGDGERAWALFDMLSPIQHAKSAQAVDIYQTEPYVVSGDVYALPPHAGRGGWSWYTGAAAWLYRLILESLLGLTIEADVLRLTPCLPAGWPSFKLSYRFHETHYDIVVSRTAALETGQPSATRMTLDGILLPEPIIRMVDDRRRHAVDVCLACLVEVSDTCAQA